MPTMPCHTPGPAAIAPPSPAAGLGRRLLDWWRARLAAADELDSLADLDPRTLRDIGCGDDVRRRVEGRGAAAHRMPECW